MANNIPYVGDNSLSAAFSIMHDTFFTEIDRHTPQLLFSGTTSESAPAVVDLTGYEMVMFNAYNNTATANQDYAITLIAEIERVKAMADNNGQFRTSLATTSTLETHISGTLDACSIYTKQTGAPATYPVKIYGINQRTELKIYFQPEDVTCAVGDVAVFSVGVQGDGLAYQWQVKTSTSSAWVDLGAASAKTAKTNVAGNLNYNGWKFRCIITDKYGNVITSDIATLTVTS